MYFCIHFFFPVFSCVALCSQQRIKWSVLQRQMEDIIAHLFTKASESNPRIQQGAAELLLTLSKLYQQALLPFLWKSVMITTPSGSTKWPPPKIIKSRVTVLISVLTELRVSPQNDVRLGGSMG